MFKQYIFVNSNNYVIGSQVTNFTPCPPDGCVAIEYDKSVLFEPGIQYIWENDQVVENGPVVVTKDYLQLRHESYPDIEDQLDLLYHRGYEGWKAYITAIKAKYPKS